MERKRYTTYTEPFFAPFYVGQKVVGSKDAPKGSNVKEGLPYTITHCHYSFCDNGKRHFWYVGYNGIEKDAWLWPGLFTAVEENFNSISLEKVLELENPLISQN